MEIEDTVLRAFEQMPYESTAYQHTHPTRMGAVGSLLGMQPAAPDRCRVLEIGCAAGWNLIAMAWQLPQAHFVGIDVARRHIEEGEAARQTLGLQNLELRVGDLSDQEELGIFDYIVAHGVYSWIAAPVQERLLALCRRHLAPQGLAYISYNCYPGWHERQAMREMMLYHTRGLTDPLQKTMEARKFLEFLAAASPPYESAYKLRLSQEVDRLNAASPDYLFHDHLATFNHPLYFHEFFAQAAGHGLQYVGDAFFPANFGHLLPPQLTAELAALTDGTRVQFEQYMDFVLARSFRKTLLCHREVTLADRPLVERVAGLHAMSPFVPGDPEPAGGSRTWTHRETRLQAVSPELEQILTVLYGRWPQAVAVQELFDAVGDSYEQGAADQPADERFCADLLGCFANDVVDLVCQPFAVGRLTDEIRTNPLVRYLLDSGKPRVITGYHDSLVLKDSVRLLARLADGTRDRPALLQALERAVAGGDLPLPVEAATPEQIQAGLEAALARGLANLERLGLLEAPPV